MAPSRRTRSFSAAARRRCSSRPRSPRSSTPAARRSTSPADAEITLEANPETRHAGTLAGFRAAGVNRLSFGVQSFRDDELQRLSRLHGAVARASAYREARARRLRQHQPRSDDVAAGADDRAVARIGRRAIALGPDQLSLYMLELYPNAPLRDDMAALEVVAGAGRRCGGDVSGGDGRGSMRAGLPAVRDLERRAGPAASRGTT